jgi:predicted peptidase
VQFTVYPEADHDSWTETYENQQVYDWMLAQRNPGFRL